MLYMHANRVAQIVLNQYVYNLRAQRMVDIVLSSWCIEVVLKG